MVGVGLLYRKGYFHQRVDRTGLQHEYWTQIFPERLPTVLCSTRRRAARGSSSRCSDARSPSTSGAPRSAACRSTCSTPSSTRTIRSTAGSPRASTRATRPPGWASTPCSGSAPSGRCGRSGSSPASSTSTRATPRSPRSSSQPSDVAGGGPTRRRARRGRGALRLHDAHARARRERDVRAAIVPRRVRRPPGRLGIDERLFLDLCRTHPGSDESPGMTPLALRPSRRANGVSRRHGEVAREMWRPLFGDRAGRRGADHATSRTASTSRRSSSAAVRGCSTATSATAGSRAVDPTTWAPVDDIPDEELWAARCERARQLIDYVRDEERAGPAAARRGPRLRAGGRRRVRPGRADARLRPPDRHLQAPLPATYDPTACADPRAAARRCSSSSPARRTRSTTTQADARQTLFGQADDRSAISARRVPRGLRPLGRRADRRRLRRVVNCRAPRSRRAGRAA